MAKQQRKEFEGAKIITPTFRASYLTVFEPRAYEEGAEPKYSVEMLFDAEKTDLTKFKKEVQALCIKAWGKDKAQWPKNFRWPWKNGDEKEDAAAHYKGTIYARADSKRAPGIYDQKRNDIMDKRELYSGCFCRASLFAVPYENIGGKGADGRSGIKFYLQGIQLVEKGESFERSSRDDFDELETPDQDTSVNDDFGGGDDGDDDDDFDI